MESTAPHDAAAALRALPVPLLTADAAGRLTFVNGAGEALLGMAFRELEGRPLSALSITLRDESGEILPPAAWPMFRVLSEGRPQMQCVEARREGDPSRWFEVHAIPWSEGGCLVTFIDVTARVLEARRARAILSTTLDGVWIVDEAARIVDVNPKACELLGFTREELCGRIVSEIEATEAPEETAAHAQRVMSLGYDRFTTAHRCRDGSLLPVEVSVTWMPEARTLLVFIRDLKAAREAEARLEAERTRFEKLVNTVDGIVWEADAQTFGFTFVGQKAEAMLGYPVSRWFEPGFWADHIHPEDREWAVAHCIACTGRLEDHDFEYRFLTADGRTVWLRDLVSVVQEGGRPRWLRGLMVDITSQKTAEAAVQASEARFRGLFESLQEGFALHDLLVDGQGRPYDYRYLEVNAAFEAMTGIPREQWLGRTVREVLPGIEPRWIEAFGRVVQTGVPVVLEDEASVLGRIFRVVAYCPEPGRFAILAADITEQRRILAELEAGRTVLAALFQQNLAAMALSTWPESRLVDVNPAWERLTGLERGGVQGRSLPELGFFPEGQQVVSVLEQLEAHGRVDSVELTLRSAGGQVHQVLWSGQLTKIRGVEHLVSSAVDITAHREALEALRVSERKFAALFHGSPDAIALSRPSDGVYLDINRGFTQLTGLGASEVIGRSSLDGDLGIWVDPKERDAVLGAIGSRGEVADVEARIRHREGHTLTCLFSASLIRIQGQDLLLSTARDISARKAGEQALANSEERLRTLIDAMQDLVVFKDGDSRWMELNAFGQRLFGLDEASFRGCLESELPLDRMRFGASLERCRVTDEAAWRSEAPHRAEETFPGADGAPRTFDVIKVPLFHPDGSRKGLVVMGRDVTERQRMEAALREANARLSGIVNALPDLLIIVDGQGRIQMVHTSEGVQALVPEEQARGRRLAELLPADVAIQGEAALDRIRRGSGLEIMEYCLALPDGADHHYEARLTPAVDDTVVILVRDVTSRIKAEAQLKASEARLHTVTRHAPDSIVQIGLDGSILYINKTVSGISMADVLGQDWMQWMPDREARRTAQEALDRSVATGEQVDYRVQGAGPHGSLRWYQARLSPVLEEGRVTSLIVFYTDITRQLQAEEERARLERQVQRAQKMESLGSLAGGVAHDMNNVLGAILGLASACRAHEPDGTRLARSLDTIATACERGGTLVRGLLNFSREGLAEEKELDLNALVREEVQLLERTTLQRVQLALELEPHLMAVRGDGGALSHALMNLCVNAVDAMAEGGMLTLRTRNAGPDRVALTVEDTGSGMSPEVLEKALDPFFTTKPVGKGTGLGLSIVYGTVKAHRGSLAIRSTPGMGTLVELEFPAVPPTSPHVLDGAAKPEHDVLRVLVVDDDALIQQSLEMLLGALGCSSKTSSSGEEALECLETGEPFDLVILDMNMPGLGGEGTLPRLRSLRPELPVLLATGRADQKVLDLVGAHGGVTILPKPFGLTALREQLSRLRG